MATCFCKAILSALVIVFAWWHFPWLGSKWALTIIGLILVFWALFANEKCCCSPCSAPAARPVVRKVAVKKAPVKRKKR
jgi:hypothetical protein